MGNLNESTSAPKRSSRCWEIFLKEQYLYLKSELLKGTAGLKIDLRNKRKLTKGEIGPTFLLISSRTTTIIFVLEGSKGTKERSSEPRSFFSCLCASSRPHWQFVKWSVLWPGNFNRWESLVILIQLSFRMLKSNKTGIFHSWTQVSQKWVSYFGGVCYCEAIGRLNSKPISGR